MATEYNIGDLVEAWSRGAPRYFRARVVATGEDTVTVEILEGRPGVVETVVVEHVRALPGDDQRLRVVAAPTGSREGPSGGLRRRTAPGRARRCVDRGPARPSPRRRTWMGSGALAC